MPNVTIRAGDIVAVPVSDSDSELYLVHVIQKLYKSLLLVASYPPPASGDPVDISGRPTLVAVTFDSLIQTGSWTIVGRKEPDPAVPIPVYKVEVSSLRNTYLQDVRGEILRPATNDEIRNLTAPVTYSAAAFQKALRLLVDGSPWESRFDAMIPNWEYCEQTLAPRT